jgi:glycosyltransferase involved in cell wall biosynthesis
MNHCDILKMKILFCSQTRLSRELGGAKVIIELAEELEQLGCQCKIIAPTDFASQQSQDLYSGYAARLHQYLIKHAAQYDVIDYDHVYLPYSRQEFSPKPLFVARSVLLAHHLDKIALPQTKTLRAKARQIIKGWKESKRLKVAIQQAHRTIEEADLVNVSNNDDKETLLQYGIKREKIIVLPFGVDRKRQPLFDRIESKPPANPKVAFVGTFDNRKGATDFPELVQRISESVPTVTFRLLGTARTIENVLNIFPAEQRNRIEVIPNYQSEELPSLLADCSVGIFPSYLEGFGFGVLEMLAASVPVIAYHAPGPPMMLPNDYLVPCGSAEAMSAKVVALLCNMEKLLEARSWAKQRAQHFSWRSIAEQTKEIYFAHWLQRQTALQQSA